ncbi:hypothetical protein [Bacillus cereus]|uniref:Uncharacterized protein n=1 Tax=Bacillus cereus TaxID=1396 RepID=A0A9X7A1N3_BACCE|nr:hypothetical protein [Bacillus cereus]PFK27799.1 hypothetical protein COI98_01370 [Bacillus cereus]
MENITVEQVSENELRIIFPCGVNYTSQKPRGISNEAKDIKVEKLNNKELKIILPEGLQITAESMTIEEFYHGLTDALVDIPRRRWVFLGLGL